MSLWLQDSFLDIFIDYMSQAINDEQKDILHKTEMYDTVTDKSAQDKSMPTIARRQKRADNNARQ